MLRLTNPTLNQEPMDVVSTLRVDVGRHVMLRVSPQVVRYVRLKENRLACSRGIVNFDPRQESVELEEYYSA
jgi:hypothetical protein